MIFENFRHGINLGGWLSQCDCLKEIPTTKEAMKEHLSSYITEENIKHISQMGFDHVRLPLDFVTITEVDNWFSYVEDCLRWCESNNLNMILDLHNIEGNIYGIMEEPIPLLKEERLREQFKQTWEKITKLCKHIESPVLIFELFNEISDGSGYLWNSLCSETVDRIRKIDSNRGILIGSNEQNSAFRLKELDLLDDPMVFYNFHFYDPQVFTHQRAHFSEEMVGFNREILYPGDISDFTKYLLQNRKFVPKYAKVALEENNAKETMKKFLKDAIDFVKYSGKELYCGEFGVIQGVPTKSSIAWILDCIEILEENHIGHALWNYKELDFGLININNEVVNEELVEGIIKAKVIAK